MMGDIVNLAARLMQHARGNVIVDKNTYDESVKEINYDISPAIKVKGKKDAIAVFSPDPDNQTGSLVRESRVTPFVGRESKVCAVPTIISVLYFDLFGFEF
jgi:class 3 adenylate cyclase